MALTPIELKQFLTPWLKEHDYINYYGTYLEQIVLPRWYKKLEQTLYKIGYGEDNQWMFVGEKSGCGTEIIKPQWQYSQLGKL
ncbi:hypothetical protein FACS1894166_12790 [Bacilli bacterium]|nr:hypothetical protein FACS1894166_12790 [Bacilli bacterium]